MTIQTLAGGPYRCALVIRPTDGVDDDLLTEIADATGLNFALYGHGGFGGESTATVYTAGDDLLMEVVCDETDAKALFVRARSAEHAAAIRNVIAARRPFWNEPTLRARLEENLHEQPRALVALLMATGGAPPEPETAELLQRALDHDAEEVRNAAEYARLVATELVHPVLVQKAQPKPELEPILRPARPVDDERHWITVRAGVPERAVPRPVTWLRTPFDDPDEAVFWAAARACWILLAVDDRDGTGWHEEIFSEPRGYRTALHIVRHPAVDKVHLALHGDAADTTATELVRDLGAEVLAGPPAGWERTAP
ncbi:hypothetical protein GCM10009678_93500 [Actinomadura kijaniata]|uniref:Uncharacterized protein n=1 Tax=Actinomadura namibiensis TaxID=182080 RepID=A0A7W3QS84_ACTNM|nr:hypothetical protein [Actinomadura namibiensis]MBA8957580.1 hypothetical protein [Actinomadura namibiensis]